jgi:predicted nuclease with TOPRIM domain
MFEQLPRPSRAKKIAAAGGIISLLLSGYIDMRAAMGDVRARVVTLEEVSGPKAVIERMDKIDSKLTEVRDRLIRIEAHEDASHAPARRTR